MSLTDPETAKLELVAAEQRQLAGTVAVLVAKVDNLVATVGQALQQQAVTASQWSDFRTWHRPAFDDHETRMRTLETTDHQQRGVSRVVVWIAAIAGSVLASLVTALAMRMVRR